MRVYRHGLNVTSKVAITSKMMEYRSDIRSIFRRIKSEIQEAAARSFLSELHQVRYNTVTKRPHTRRMFGPGGPPAPAYSNNGHGGTAGARLGQIALAFKGYVG